MFVFMKVQPIHSLTACCVINVCSAPESCSRLTSTNLALVSVLFLEMYLCNNCIGQLLQQLHWTEFSSDIDQSGGCLGLTYWTKVHVKS